jgi:transcriptional regulator with XRE-family HTH domain
MRLVDEPLRCNLAEHVSFTTMNDEDRKTAEETVGANIKTRRAQLGLTQAQLAEAMQGLGHSWIQTTVAKTEAADRPLRVNELADLARVLDVRVPELVSTDADWAIESINTTLAMHGANANRLESEIEELNRQVAVKAQALEETRQRIQELQAEFWRVRGEH